MTDLRSAAERARDVLADYRLLLVDSFSAATPPPGEARMTDSLVETVIEELEELDSVIAHLNAALGVTA